MTLHGTRVVVLGGTAGIGSRPPGRRRRGRGGRCRIEPQDPVEQALADLPAGTQGHPST